MKSYIKNHRWAYNLSSRIYRIIGRNKISIRGGKGNNIDLKVPGLFISKSRFVVDGNNNSVIFMPNKIGKVTHLSRLSIKIYGNDNTIIIGAHSSGDGLSISIENNNNKVILGKGFTVGPNTELAAIEGTTIVFGEDCQLSANITLRTGDSHSITDLQGKRTNPSKSIKIGNHVWIGNSVLIFKGTQISDNSIIAGGSVVTGGKIYPANSIIGGNPSRIIKENVNWERQRLPL